MVKECDAFGDDGYQRCANGLTPRDDVDCISRQAAGKRRAPGKVKVSSCSSTLEYPRPARVVDHPFHVVVTSAGLEL